MRYCVGIDLDYVLKMPDTEAGRMLKDSDGNVLSAAAVKTHAVILKAQGYVVMPVSCSNHDKKGYCNGHE